jgi:SAM-dependent methyltransferase
MMLQLRLRAILLVLLAVASRQAIAQTADDEVWRQFIQWLPSASAPGHPGALYDAYQKFLIGTGVSKSEAARRREIVLRRARSTDDGWRLIYNTVYSSSQLGFRTEPNATLVSAIKGRPPGRALDVGMGQGRNTIFLALRGWDTTGFDLSDAGLELARRNAEKAGVKITALNKSEKDFNYGVSQWDLILFCYVPFPIWDASYVGRLRLSLRPHGLIVTESFGSAAGAAGRRSVDVDPIQLRRAFRGFDFRKMEDLIDRADWSDKPERVIRVIIENP